MSGSHRRGRTPACRSCKSAAPCPNDASAPLGNGTLCIAGPLVRYAPLVLSGPTGEARLTLDLTTLPASLSAIPGATVRYQYWFRDPAAGGSQSNLTDGLRITWQ